MILVIGLGVSFAYPIGIAASVAVPALVFRQHTRGSAFASAFLYYAVASWALVPAAAAFLGREPSALTPVFLWCCAALLLAGPWALMWSPDRKQLSWRAPLALTAGIIPPLGLIGWASPVTAAGLLFPGTGLFGLAGVIIFAGGLAARPRSMVLIGAAAVLIAHATYPGDPSPPSGWQGINTQFGASDPGDITAEYLRAQAIQQRARVSEARVIIFPESVLSQWTEGTDLFWKETLASLRDSGRTILIGATAPTITTADRQPFSFSAELAALQGSSLADERFGILGALRTSTVPASYRNTVVIRGAASGMLEQRIPVPVGMWNPFTGSGVPLNLRGPSSIEIADTRVAILICYEQLLVWPMLTAIAEAPDVLVAVANIHSISGTPIPACQAASVRSWARLFRLPAVFAVNS